MKYIDAEKLIALIDAKLEDLGMSGSVWVGRSVLNELKDDIESLQQEQPSLPSNLDEAAEKAGLEYAPKQGGEAIDANGDVYATDDVEWPSRCGFMKGFKAGAEWMAGQGATMEITDDTEWADLDSFVHKNVTGGSIIQIRKK